MLVGLDKFLVRSLLKYRCFFKQSTSIADRIVTLEHSLSFREVESCVLLRLLIRSRPGSNSLPLVAELHQNLIVRVPAYAVEDGAVWAQH